MGSVPCTKLHKGEQKDRTKTLAEFPDHIFNDYGGKWGQTAKVTICLFQFTFERTVRFVVGNSAFTGICFQI